MKHKNLYFLKKSLQIVLNAFAGLFFVLLHKLLLGNSSFPQSFSVLQSATLTCMDLQKVNELEAKAGDALAKDQLEDSIRVYSEAIDLARSVLSVKFAGLLSKRAEAHLKQKK